MFWLTLMLTTIKLFVAYFIFGKYDYLKKNYLPFLQVSVIIIFLMVNLKPILFFFKPKVHSIS